MMPATYYKAWIPLNIFYSKYNYQDYIYATWIILWYNNSNSCLYNNDYLNYKLEQYVLSWMKTKSFRGDCKTIIFFFYLRYVTRTKCILVLFFVLLPYFKNPWHLAATEQMKTAQEIIGKEKQSIHIQVMWVHGAYFSSTFHLLCI